MSFLRLLTQSCSKLVWLIVICVVVDAARTARLADNQPEDGTAALLSSWSNQRHRRSVTNSNKERSHSSSVLRSSMTVAGLEQYVNERIEQLETRFNQRLDDQSRKLNQSVAIKYIENFLDYIGNELQASHEKMLPTGQHDQNDSITTATKSELSREVDRQRDELDRVRDKLSELQAAVDHLVNTINEHLRLSTATDTGAPSAAVAMVTSNSIQFSTTAFVFPADCQDAYDRGIIQPADGFHYTMIKPQTAKEQFRACCYVNNSVSWTVIQRRINGSVDFYRNWHEYKHGFGQLESEFWFGNEQIYKLTSQGNYRLRVEMITWDENSYWAEYQSFWLSPESDRYRLHVSGFVPESDAGDSLTSTWNNDHNNQSFSTYDCDNDARFYDNCAQHYRGAWWFRSCFQSHLNGVYYHRGAHSNFFVRNGVQWNTIHPHASLRNVAMMIRHFKSDNY